MDSLLVIAAVDDGNLRRKAEDLYVENFEALGVEVVPGSRFIGTEVVLSRAVVEAAIADGNDGKIALTVERLRDRGLLTVASE